MRVLDSYSQASGQDSCFCVSYYGRTSAALLLSRGGMRNLGRCRIENATPCKVPWNGSNALVAAIYHCGFVKRRPNGDPRLDAQASGR